MVDTEGEIKKNQEKGSGVDPFEHKLGMSIFSGTRWNIFSRLCSQGTKFIVSIVLARLLAPQDFGLMALAMVVIGFMEIFKDLGTVPAIIQRKELTDEILSSLFFLNVSFGVITGGVIASSASIAAWFYGNSHLTPILQVLALTFVISSIGLVNQALLQREMLFSRLALVELSAVIVYGVLAIVLALYGCGVWSLVGGAIAASIISTVLFLVVMPWKPRVFFHWSDVRTFFNFSLNLTGANIGNYLIHNLDKIIIGKFLGATVLGFYDLAQRILITPSLAITSVLMRVLLPGFSKFQDDDIQIKRKYLRACAAIALVCFPALGGLSVLARPFILTIFGSKWIPAIPIIIILSPSCIIQSLATTVGVIYLVKGRTDWLFKWIIFAGICLTSGYIIGLKWGILGIVSGYLIANVLLIYPTFAIPFRLINLKFVDLLYYLKPYATATVIMLFLVMGIRIGLEYLDLGQQIVLIWGVITGIFVYTSIILYSRPQALADLQKMFFLREFVRKGT